MSGPAGAVAGRRRAAESAALNDSLASLLCEGIMPVMFTVARAVAPFQADPPPALFLAALGEFCLFCCLEYRHSTGGLCKLMFWLGRSLDVGP